LVLYQPALDTSMEHCRNNGSAPFYYQSCAVMATRHLNWTRIIQWTQRWIEQALCRQITSWNASEHHAETDLPGVQFMTPPQDVPVERHVSARNRTIGHTDQSGFRLSRSDITD
jgi:hypothetical protein